MREPNPHLTLTKETTSTPANGETYALNETITYEIIVTNDGNLTVTNIVVTDTVTGYVLCKLGVIVNVHLHHEKVISLLGDLLHHGKHHTAGAAPIGIEVNQGNPCVFSHLVKFVLIYL